MKKLFTLCLALLALSSVPAVAQNDDEEIDNTLQFVDSKGNAIADGSVLTVDSVEDLGFQSQISSGVFVKNTSSETVYAGMEVNITRLDNGSISCCFPVNCQIGEHVGTFSTMAGEIGGGTQNKTIQTEWVPSDATSYGQASAVFRICMYVKGPGTKYIPTGYGPSVTINFVNRNPAGIKSIGTSTAGKKVAAIYNVRGESLSQMQKGLNIVRYTDGTVKKVLL